VEHERDKTLFIQPDCAMKDVAASGMKKLAFPRQKNINIGKIDVGTFFSNR
jgi:hypothetical protein